MITNDRRDWLIARLDEALRGSGLAEVSECLHGMEADAEVSDLMPYLATATAEKDGGKRERAIAVILDRLVRNDPRG